MIENKGEEKRIFDAISIYYPVNIDRYSQEFDVSKEHKTLLDKLKKASGDRRWEEFIALARSNKYYDIMDCSTFGFPIPCFKANIYLTTGNDRYEIVFYVSIILDYYAFRTELLFNEPQVDINLSAENRKQILEAVKEQYLKHKSVFKPMLNEFPDQISHLMLPLFQYQEAAFGYKLLPVSLANKIVPGVATNSKTAGTASVFDCVFTDFEL
ncbi:MAG TPA: hypothetical protein VGN00_29755 [Puia sp.]